MKKFLIYFIVFISIFSVLNVNAEEFNINSSNAVLYNLNDNSILYEKESNEKVSIASLTKIMTAVVAIENIDDLDSKVIIDAKDFEGLAEANLATAGFRIGEEVTYRDLLYGLLFPSGADAAQALTRNIAGSNEDFVMLMNKKVKKLKLENTHFVNPTGLDDENHYSTVKDVATIFKYALKNKKFKEIIETTSYKTSNGRLTFKSATKRTVDKYYLDMNYLLGGKTGTTGDAGLCLASIATYNNVDYMLVTVRAPYIKGNPLAFRDAKEIYEYYMNNYSYQQVLSKDEVILTLDTLYTRNDKVDFKSEKDLKLYLKNYYDKKYIKYKYTGTKIITYKIKKGTKLGKLKIYYKNKLIDEIDVILSEKQKLDIVKYLLGHKLLVIILFIFIIAMTLKIRRK